MRSRVPDTRHGCSPYAGRRAGLATKHGKLAVVAGPLADLGLRVEAVEVDTDAFGTFSGDAVRPAAPHKTAVGKARSGMAASGLPLALASEGSFGPDPSAAWVTLARELVVLVDDERGLVVTGTAASHDVVALATTAAPDDDLVSLPARAGLPQHALIVAPHVGGIQPLCKGLTDLGEIAEAVTASASTSSDGRARIESDLRAHCSPSRRAVIAAAARDLASRLARSCPA